MFAFLLASSISATESLEVQKIHIGDQTAIIPTKHLHLFIHAMELIREGKAEVEPYLNTSMDNLRKYLQPWLKEPREENGEGFFEFAARYLHGIGGYFVGHGSVSFAKESVQNKRLDFGGGVACIFGVICVGGGYVGIHSAETQESIYLRVTETEDGLVFLPSYDAEAYEDLQEQIAEGKVTLD